MASEWAPVPTPPADRDRQPTGGEIQFFRSHPHLVANFKIVAEKNPVYNCMGWSLGFNDRWIDGGTPEQMLRLYAFYFYVPVQSANEAEIDNYMKRDAPQTRVVQRQEGPVSIPYAHYNIVTHAHRNDHRNAALGSTSKMHTQVLIRHDRSALADNRPWNQVAYGQICGYHRKSPEHPLKPGKSKNANLIPGVPPGPNDMMWAVPRTYPIGHPLEGSTGGLYSNPGDLAGNKAKKAPSLRYYAPHKRIPAPSQAAVSYIRQVLSTMSKKRAAAELINNFETYYKAWKKTWFAGQVAMSSNSITRTQVPEFGALVRLGSSIVPLVVAKLCDPHNALEKDARYKVSAMDAPNYLVLQRHANLIVEINKGRFAK